MSVLNMRVLIIHPQDPSTNFLKPIYATIHNKTVINGGVTRIELINLIQSHDRVMMLGHGTPEGLLSIGQFPDSSTYVIDRWIAPLLAEKEQNVFIWCNADQYVNKHRLNGFFSGMFISEESETFYCDLWDLDSQIIDESNELFVSAVAKYINEPLHVLHKNVINEYGILAKTNPIAEYNWERLYFSERKMNSLNRSY